jgi:hypothetical protein
MAAPKVMSPEVRKQICKDCEVLIGTVSKRSSILSKTYPFHRHTIREVIKDLPCIDKIGSTITDAEKRHIKQLFEQCEHPIMTHRFNYIASIVSRSTASIKKIIEGITPLKEKMYNTIDHPFF